MAAKARGKATLVTMAFLVVVRRGQKECEKSDAAEREWSDPKEKIGPPRLSGVENSLWNHVRVHALRLRLLHEGLDRLLVGKRRRRRRKTTRKLRRWLTRKRNQRL